MNAAQTLLGLARQIADDSGLVHDSPSEIIDITQMSKTEVNAAVKELENAGQIEVVSALGGKRIRLLKLDEKGFRTVQTADGGHEAEESAETDSRNLVKSWTLRVAACRNLTPAMALVGAVIAQHANYKTGTVYLGEDRLAKAMNRDKKTLKARRDKLIELGWLRNTDEYVKRARVRKLNVPDCGCESCAPEPGDF
ncbi:helix-turn-helix domain-containing protein [Streptomyces yunnanensis]|uniref:Helix-turn-helix domain-containing protein n=1 Tax=Streptomyces yunnanensis TaxID=156453 RepID=A0A9X8N4X6_9ACTN|nr:helix-turn-helix domain-containing protein [Streptomyces yunnanensis]SHM99723.1 Helix-turn-helix domain-containing protein [Streptomyces yunnanensis]